jgi:hypothetical protein
VPALVSGVFKADEGNLGIFIVNVTEKPIACRFALRADQYPISEAKSCRVAQFGEDGERIQDFVSARGEISYHGQAGPHDVVFVEARQ